MKHAVNVTHGIVNRAKNSIFSYQGWPSVCRDENGTLYVVASGMRVAHVCPFGKTVMYISKNNGETWTPPIVVNDDYLDDRDAGILYMGNGRMLVTWFAHSTNAYRSKYAPGIRGGAQPIDKPVMGGMLDTFAMVPEEWASGGSFLRISEDYGVTWSEPIKLPISTPHGPNLCSDGSLLYLGKDMYITEEDNNTHGHIRAYKSIDGGYTWNELAILPIPAGTKNHNFHEPHVIELPDGRLFGAIRAQGNEIQPGFTFYTTESTDGGRTWTMPVNQGIDGSPPHLLLHSSGKLICVYGRRVDQYSIRAILSDDGGKTWSEEIVLEDRIDSPDLGYPASVELDDGSVMTVYYMKCRGDDKCSILYTRWNPAELA